MCFGGGGGPSAAEKEAALDQREEAEAQKREEIEDKARSKRDSISEAVQSRDAGLSGGSGRRSLFSRRRTTAGSGYSSRFG